MRKFNKLILVTLLFVASLTIPQTYAYWSNVDYTYTQTANTIVAGEWNPAFPWISGRSYNINERVIYNGVTYRSLQSGNTRTPGATNAKQWWQAI